MNVLLPTHFLNRPKTSGALSVLTSVAHVLFLWLFIYLWLCWLFVAVAWAFSSCSEQRLLSSFGARPSHCSDISSEAMILGLMGFSSYSSEASCPKDLSSWNRNRTHVPWIGRQILNHQTTREVLFLIFFESFLYWNSPGNLVTFVVVAALMLFLDGILVQIEIFCPFLILLHFPFAFLIIEDCDTIGNGFLIHSNFYLIIVE